MKVQQCQINIWDKKLKTVTFFSIIEDKRVTKYSDPQSMFQHYLYTHTVRQWDSKCTVLSQFEVKDTFQSQSRDTQLFNYTHVRKE